MKTVVRIFMFLLTLGLLVGLAGSLAMITPIPWASDFVGGLTERYAWLPLAFAIAVLFCIAAGVLALVLIVTVHPKKNIYTLSREAGTIEITRQSIESEASDALENMQEVRRYHVQAKGDMRPGKLRLNVEVEPRDRNADLAGLGEAIQQHLAGAMAQNLAMEPKHIKVRIREAQPAAEVHRGQAKVPRVL